MVYFTPAFAGILTFVEDIRVERKDFRCNLVDDPII